MKKPPMRLSDLKGSAPKDDKTYSKASPKMARLKKGKVLTPAEKAAFLASRPDLKG